MADERNKESKNIKEIKEMLKGLELIGSQGAKIAKGGVNFKDIPHVIELVKDYEVLDAAFSGLKEIPAEAKDLDEAELMELGLIVFRMVKNMKAAYDNA
jgi:hypothetical protein